MGLEKGGQGEGKVPQGLGLGVAPVGSNAPLGSPTGLARKGLYQRLQAYPWGCARGTEGRRLRHLGERSDHSWDMAQGGGDREQHLYL